MKATLIIIICSLLVSCVGFDVSTDEFSLNGQIPSDKSLLIVYRVNKKIGSGVIYDLKIDNQSIGVLKTGQYKKICVESGIHEFKSFREIEVKLTKELKPGMVYFLEERHAFGKREGRPKLKFVSKEKAYKELSKCYDVDSTNEEIETKRIKQAEATLERMTPEQRHFATQILVQFTTESTVEDISKVLGPPSRGSLSSPQWYRPGTGLNEVVEATFIEGKLFQIHYIQLIPFFRWEIILQDGELKPKVE